MYTSDLLKSLDEKSIEQISTEIATEQIYSPYNLQAISEKIIAQCYKHVYVHLKTQMQNAHSEKKIHGNYY